MGPAQVETDWAVAIRIAASGLINSSNSANAEGGDRRTSAPWTMDVVYPSQHANHGLSATLPFYSIGRDSGGDQLYLTNSPPPPCSHGL